MKYQIIVDFENIDELKEYLNSQDKVKKTVVKKPNDKRGCKTSSLHIKAKEYQILNPEIGYKDCLKIVGKEIRDNKQKEIPVNN